MKKNNIYTSSFLALLLTTSCLMSAENNTKEAEDKAEPISLKISGKITALGGGVSQTDQANGKGGAPLTFQVPVSDLNFVVKGVSSSGFEYGYHTRLRAISEAASITRSYVEFKGYFGIIQIGNVKGPDDTMATFGAYNLLGGTGGISGSVTSFYNMPSGVIEGTGLIGSPGSATKLVYYSPEFYGFKVGVSYTPNTMHAGKKPRDNSHYTGVNDGNESAIYPDSKVCGYGLNNFTIGLSYETEWTDSKLNLNFVTVFESAKFVFNEYINAFGVGTKGNRYTQNLHKTNSYMISAQYDYKDISFAASWLDNQKSRLPTQNLEQLAEQYSNHGKSFIYFATDNDPTINTHQGDSGSAWNVGARYKFGSYEAALGYFETNRKNTGYDKTKLSAVTASIEMKALDGLVFFGEMTALRGKTNQRAVDAAQNFINSETGGTDKAIKNNSGAVFMAGTKVSF